jgi:hypothetical protein
LRSLDEKIADANRLKNIAERVGFALWQLQELERVSAQYFVLIAQAKRGMGFEAGAELTNKALGKTFGKTISNLVKSGLLSTGLEQKFQSLLEERNWLVHNSRASSRNAVYNEVAYNELVFRLDTLAEQALSLLKEIGQLALLYVKKHGVSQAEIDEVSAQTLHDWRENGE